MLKPSISPISVLFLIGAAQGGFLSLLLFTGRFHNKAANRFLASLLLVLSISLIDGFLCETNYYVLFPKLLGLEWPTNFLYGPLFFLYISSLIQRQHSMSGPKMWLPFVPALIFALYLAPFYLMNDGDKILWWTHNGSGNSIRDIDPIVVLVVIQMAFYLAVSQRRISSYSVRLKRTFSNLEKISLSWISSLILTLCILWLIFTAYVIISPFFGLYREAGNLLHLSCAAVVFVMGFRGIKQPELFGTLQILSSIETAAANERETMPDVARQEEEPIVSKRKENEKYKKSNLTNEQSEVILGRLSSLMENEKPFLEMGLSLPELSAMLSVSSNHLSQVINDKLKKSYFDFVNEYRIAEAEKLLISPQSSRFSILDIAMESGFSSKSSFYSAFKKYNNMTPSQFRNRQMSNDVLAENSRQTT